VSDLNALGDLFGILPHYFAFNGEDRHTTDDTRRAFLAANGVDVSSDASITETLHRMRAEAETRWFPAEQIIEAFSPWDFAFGLGAAWQVTPWGGGDGGDTDPVAEGQAGDHLSLPPLPPDVYDLRLAVAGRVEHIRLLAAPRKLPQLGALVEPPKIWGMTAALYGLQSQRSTGVGDFADLATLCQAAARAGAGFVGINPVHNIGFSDSTAISPYSPSHRGFFNTDHIALDQIPGLEGLDAVRKLLQNSAPDFTAIKAQELIEYSAQRQCHRALLDQLYGVFQKEAGQAARKAFAAYEAERGAELARFARFEALCEVYGADWRDWPASAMDARPTDPRTRFHAWLQWVADHQLGQAQQGALAAGMPLGLYLDLSVGARRDGGEAWCERSVIARGVSIGAPPDQLGPDGQNWNLAAFSPHLLAEAGYAPLRMVLAQTMRHAGVIRIDHVLGLNRSFWIPDDGSPGAYIRQPFEALLAIIKIEAHRAATLVVGEDLGLVPEGFRNTMQSHGFYGYSVLQYERDNDGQFRDPTKGPPHVLSCFATHDTPTIRGYEHGRDLDWWHQLGSLDDAAHAQRRADRQEDVAALKRFAPQDATHDLVQAVHGALGAASAEMVCLQLDDILEQVEAQNLPGTIDQHPNWRRRHGIALDHMDAAFAPVAALMRAQGRANRPIPNKEPQDEH
jgi:4-alpha-glucanotransferase